jgi:hypothetical protein
MDESAVQQGGNTKDNLSGGEDIPSNNQNTHTSDSVPVSATTPIPETGAQPQANDDAQKSGQSGPTKSSKSKSREIRSVQNRLGYDDGTADNDSGNGHPYENTAALISSPESPAANIAIATSDLTDETAPEATADRNDKRKNTLRSGATPKGKSSPRERLPLFIIIPTAVIITAGCGLLLYRRFVHRGRRG